MFPQTKKSYREKRSLDSVIYCFYRIYISNLYLYIYCICICMFVSLIYVTVAIALTYALFNSRNKKCSPIYALSRNKKS